MSDEPSPEVTGMEGATALPRSNGELAFEAPWEGRAFGIAVNLNEQGLYPWTAFRDELVHEIGSAEAEGQATSYYERWLATLEKVLLEKGIITPQELAKRTEEYVSGIRDDDWDHDDHH
jgi:nitrile hydratase accessory protein